MNVFLDFPHTPIITQIELGVARAQKLLDARVLADSNYFCPEDKGTLQTSAVISSGGGELVWDTPYAAYQYYEAPNKSLDRNPNARGKWFEHAKKDHAKDWERLANEPFN